MTREEADKVLEYQRELLNHLFELSYALDSKSAERNLVGLRDTHYKNQIWLHDHGLTEDYYKYFLKTRFGGQAEREGKE